MLLRLSALLAAFALSAFAQPAPPAPSSAAAQAADPDVEETRKTALHVARNGNEVIVSWVLPKVEIKQFEIFRNTRDQAQGRTRAAAVRTEPAVYYDSVTDAETTYWYWLKITLKSGQVVNVGPVATPVSKVWTP